MVERALVAASKAQLDGFDSTSAALREIAKLWNEPSQFHATTVSETPDPVS